MPSFCFSFVVDEYNIAKFLVDVKLFADYFSYKNATLRVVVVRVQRKKNAPR
jgi:hypothetical protein